MVLAVLKDGNVMRTVTAGTSSPSPMLFSALCIRPLGQLCSVTFFWEWGIICEGEFWESVYVRYEKCSCVNMKCQTTNCKDRSLWGHMLTKCVIYPNKPKMCFNWELGRSDAEKERKWLPTSLICYFFKVVWMPMSSSPLSCCQCGLSLIQPVATHHSGKGGYLVS